MMHLTQKSIDATWQRDIRVHNSSILNDEYRVLAHTYVSNLRRLLHRYQLIRGGIGIGAAAVMTLPWASCSGRSATVPQVWPRPPFCCLR